jgi:tRNA pseudouridine38-40 synthase
MKSRYFIEVGYMGKSYSGFQVQENANTVQAELEKALSIYFRRNFELTGSSRTDAGVHARQNFFHFEDAELVAAHLSAAVYHLNAILPFDIVIAEIKPVENQFHCRFDAKSRSYEYVLYNRKDPFLSDRAYYYPYPMELSLLQEAAAAVAQNNDFKAFSKKNTQVHHYECKIKSSEWSLDGHVWRYKVTGNRFLRGMVRGLVGTMLRVGAQKMSVEEFKEVLQSGDMTRVDFSVPAQGLTLMAVKF